MKLRDGYKVTGVGVIPKEWSVETLGDLGTWYGGGTPSKANPAYWTNGTNYWVSSQDVKQKYVITTDNLITDNAVAESSAKLTTPGSLIMVMRSGILKHTFPVAITPSSVAINQDIKTLSPANRVSSEYVYAYLTLRNRDIVNNLVKTGTTVESVEYDQLKKFPIPLPPLPEQQKIADILSVVDEHISETEALIEKTKALKQGMMQRLLTKGIGHTEFKDTEIGRIPAEWDVCSLEKVKSFGRYSMAGGPFGSDLKAVDYRSTGVRIIQLQNIGDGSFYNDYRIYTSYEKADELLKCNIYPGDIIIAKMADPVARACIIPPIESRYLMASDGIRLEVDKEHHDTKFIMFSINFERFRRLAEQNGTGTTRLRIGLETLRQLPLALPLLPEQQKIADILTTIDDQIDTYQTKVDALTQFKSGLMQQLLTGKTRVKV